MEEVLHLNLSSLIKTKHNATVPVVLSQLLSIAAWLEKPVWRVDHEAALKGERQGFSGHLRIVSMALMSHRRFLIWSISTFIS